MEEMEKEMNETFDVTQLNMPTDDREVVLNPLQREELKAKADTLMVRLAPVRAVLYQREAAPFTNKDLELRKNILELYPRERSTPFTLGFYREPKFRVKDEAS